MKIFEYIDRINLMHKLISERRTGTSEEFGVRLGISRTRIYEVIDELKSRGVPIQYSKVESTFYYEHPFDIRLICILQPLTEVECSDRNGGANIFPLSFFSGHCAATLASVTLRC